jgi:hypothetical protein
VRAHMRPGEPRGGEPLPGRAWRRIRESGGKEDFSIWTDAQQGKQLLEQGFAGFCGENAL